LTGEPVSARSEPACAPKATGSSSADGGRSSRIAIRTAADSRAATAPFGVMTAVPPATTSMRTAVSRAGRAPAPASIHRPSHAVTPVASSASPTTNSDAMNTTAGSPKPASDCS